MLRVLFATVTLLFTGFAAVSAAQAQGVESPSSTPPSARWWLQGEVHLSIFSDVIEQSTIGLNGGYGAKAGYRWSEWGVFLQAEHNLWTQFETGGANGTQGAFNLGPGVEHLYFDGRVRFAGSLGPSVLLFTTALDDAGTVGLFVDLRPAGLRWPRKRVTLQWDPLTFTVIAPVLTGIPLVQIEYRTAFAVELDVTRSKR